MNRQRLILFVLAILFVVAVIWSYTAIPRYKTVSTIKRSPGKQVKTTAPPAKSTSGTTVDNRVLKLALLEQGQASFKGYRRNIFKPLFVDELKLAKQKAVAVMSQSLIPPNKPVQIEPAQPVAPVVAQPVTVPLARFTFLGFLKKDAQRTIFLAKDKDIILVKKGDKIAGRYEASSITDQALTLRVSDTGDEIVIPLFENRPLSAAR